MAAELYFMAPMLTSQDSGFIWRTSISAYILMLLKFSEPTDVEESRMKTTSTLGPHSAQGGEAINEDGI